MDEEEIGEGFSWIALHSSIIGLHFMEIVHSTVFNIAVFIAIAYMVESLFELRKWIKVWHHKREHIVARKKNKKALKRAS